MCVQSCVRLIDVGTFGQHRDVLSAHYGTSEWLPACSSPKAIEINYMPIVHRSLLQYEPRFRRLERSCPYVGARRSRVPEPKQGVCDDVPIARNAFNIKIVFLEWLI